MRQTGRVAESAPPRPQTGIPAGAAVLGGSVQLRHVNAGSCNACEVEITSAFAPVYDVERYGIRIKRCRIPGSLWPWVTALSTAEFLPAHTGLWARWPISCRWTSRSRDARRDPKILSRVCES